MFLLVGLGNDQKSLLESRHNVGFRVLDKIINQYNINFNKQKYKAYISEGLLNKNKIIALKPKTMMNLSGISVAQAVKFYKICHEKIIVFHDDLDINLGKLKIKMGGGNAGHNGLKSIDNLIGQNYMRARIGIGHPGEKNLVNNYVLNKFTEKENIIITNLIKKISDNIALILDGKIKTFLSKIE